MNTFRFFVLCLCFASAVPVGAQPSKIEAAAPIILSPQEAVREGKALVAKLLNLHPEAVTNTGVLRVRNRTRNQREQTILFSVHTAGPKTVSTYQVGSNASKSPEQVLRIIYTPGAPNEYFLGTSSESASGANLRKLPRDQTMVPFAGSDFWVADLGLEFLHWPVQLVVRKEMRRGQATSVLESINTQPRGQEYSRVVSWIDNDTGGIVHADAYDSAGKLLKQFSPTHLQRIEGQYQVRQIEMRNRQTGSRSIIEFNLK